MEKRIRLRKETDHADVDHAVDLIYELMSLNKQLEPTLWVSALLFVLYDSFKQSGFSHEDCKEDINQAIDHYKKEFDKEIS